MLDLVAEFLRSEGIPLAAGMVALAAESAGDQPVGQHSRLYTLLQAAVHEAEKVAYCCCLSLRMIIWLGVLSVTAHAYLARCAVCHCA